MEAASTNHGEASAPSALHAMLWANSVAVVGASNRRGSVGRRVMMELAEGRFGGSVIPVTPNHDEVMGIATIPAIDAMQDQVDVAILAVSDIRLEDQMLAAKAAKARGAVVFSPAIAQASTGEAMAARLGSIAKESGMALCGPNGMGFVNVGHGLRATAYFQPPKLKPGGVTFLSHSGSLFSAMLHNRGRINFNLVVSTGLESATTMDEYLDHALDLDSTQVVGMFVETIWDTDGMSRALVKAAEMDVPILVLKVGESEAGKQCVATHSGALAGSHAAHRAFFDAHGVHCVDDMEEMVNALELFASGRRARNSGLGTVHDSGGERAMLVDLAVRADVTVAEIGDQTKARLTSVLDDGLEPVNPVDVWATGHNPDVVVEEAIRALAADPAVGAIGACFDLTSEDDPDEAYTGVLERVASEVDVPLFVLVNLVSATDPVQADVLRACGVPVLLGTRAGLAAARHLLSHRRSTPPIPGVPSTEEADNPRRSWWHDRLSKSGAIGQTEALTLVRDYGIPVVPFVGAEGLTETVAGAHHIGYPVALKTDAPTLHKTEVDGVMLAINDESELRSCYREMERRLGPKVIVQRMVASGPEILLGIHFDDQFGPLVVVGAGGRLVDLFDDGVFGLPPVDRSRAADMVDRLRFSAVLDGYRGSAAVDREALHRCIVQASRIALDFGELIGGMDINPLILGPSGAVAVDAAIVSSPA